MGIEVFLMSITSMLILILLILILVLSSKYKPDHQFRTVTTDYKKIKSEVSEK